MNKRMNKKYLEYFDASLENGCARGNEIKSNYGGFRVKRSLHRGDYAESHHCDSVRDKKEEQC